jgi:Tol biopolymer transport system component
VRGTDRAALSPAAWSPDGRRFAYGARDGVWVHAPGDPAGKRIAEGENVTAVAWSGPADVIAYVDRGALQTVRPDGAQRRKITIPGVVSRPVWAPGGDRLAVAVQPAGQGAAGAQVWWTSPDGTVIRQILWDSRGRRIGALGWFPDALYLFVGLVAADGDATVEWWKVRIA